MQDAEAVVEIGLSLPIGVFTLTVASAGRRSRIGGRPAKRCWRAGVVTARSGLRTFGHLADDVINTLWPVEAVACAPRRGFDRPVRTVGLTETEEQQAVWKAKRQANR